MGEHAAVYRRPALVATVGLMTEVVIEASSDSGVAAELVNLDRTCVWRSQDISRFTEQARRRWHAYVADPNADRLDQLVERGGAERLVQLAIGEAAQASGIVPSGVRLRISSQLPLGAGMGSSASVASAIVGAWMAFHGESIDAGRVADIALEVERRQHGSPSGVDHQTVIQGGVVWAVPEGGQGQVAVEPVALEAGLDLAIVDTGSPQQSTGAVVEAVRDQVGGERYPGWNRMQLLTEDFRRRLEVGEDPLPVVRSYHQEMQQLGIVPTEVADWIGTWQDGGGAAKLSGAGATVGKRAGCLLAFPDGEDLKIPSSWNHYRTALGVPGLVIETC